MDNLNLKEALIKNEKINVSFGIDFNTLMLNKEYHNKLFYDKWGIPWKIRGNVLYYGNAGYKPNQKLFHWEKAYIQGCDLQYKKFFTLEDFLKIKPSYL